MKITLVNQSHLQDAVVQEAVRAINLQLIHDFRQAWDMVAEVELVGSQSTRITRRELRGDAVLYLRKGDGLDVGALGYHDYSEIPSGVIFTENKEENWTVTLSHEVLETVLDPQCNRLVVGPDPRDRSKLVAHWMEACDAVQADTYTIMGVEVSDFVLPQYFTPRKERGERLSFLGAEIESFGITDGGYVGFWDPVSGSHDTFFRDIRGKVAASKAIKYKRGNRYMGAAL